MFFLVIAGNAASSTDPVKMTLSNLDENFTNKRADNNNYDQASYQEKFLALRKKQLENQVALEKQQMQFLKNSLMNKENWTVRKEKRIASFLQSSTILKEKQIDAK